MSNFNTNLLTRIPARQPINSKEIFSVDDFPDPVAGTPPTITLEDNIVYFINDDIDVGGNQILIGSDVRIRGHGTDSSVIRGSLASDALINTNGNTLIAENVTFVQDGAGALIDADMDALVGGRSRSEAIIRRRVERNDGREWSRSAIVRAFEAELRLRETEKAGEIGSPALT